MRILNPRWHIASISEIVGSTALSLYDTLLTLQREVHYVWRQKLAGATVIYLLNRYVYAVIPLSELVQTDAAENNEVSVAPFLRHLRPPS